MREIEWTETALGDMAALDKGVARRVKQSVERFAETGAGDVKKLQGSTRLSTASASATTGSASTWTARSFASSASATAARPTAEPSWTIAGPQAAAQDGALGPLNRRVCRPGPGHTPR
ncbi:MAG: hypothetical protein ABSG03_04460 [Bryobacteraceae bacterium]